MSHVAYDALVFDLDGTLWDATAASAIGWSRAGRAHGIEREISAGDIASVCGLTFDCCARTLFPEAFAPGSRPLLRDLPRYEEAAVREHGGVLYDGVASGLAALSERAPLFVLSNCHRWYLDLFLDQSGLRPLFRDSLCHGDTGLPKAENLELLRERHALRRPVYAGDTGGDREAARLAGFAFLHAAWGFGQLEHTPAFTSFPELREHLLRGG
jgi:phosphoglycolate phosphatase